MILHDNPTAEIWQDNSLSSPHFKNCDGGLKTFDFVVANPPFSNKAWSNGFDPANDEYQRFEDGVPPKKNGDYAFLLHLLRSLKSTGKGPVEYEAYLARVVALTKQVHNPTGGMAYPRSLDTRAKRALYDNLGQDEQLAVDIDYEIRSTKKDGWRGNRIKEREVRYVIRRHVPDEAEAERILELVKNQSEY
jgi:hypothetical protein